MEKIVRYHKYFKNLSKIIFLKRRVSIDTGAKDGRINIIIDGISV